MVGIFDSGYGGLTILDEILKINPQLDYIYLGDNARSPYGPQLPENIINFTLQAVEFLVQKGAKTVVIACNTASSISMKQLQTTFPKVKFIDVISPTVSAAITITKSKRIGVMGTKATIESQSYPKLISALNSEISTYGRACPLLVPFIEENWHNKPEATSIAKKYLKPLKSANIDVLILGCTHYPFMQKTLQRIIGHKVRILTSGEATAKVLYQSEDKLNFNKNQQVFTTGTSTKFDSFLKQHFPQLPKSQECNITKC